MDLRWVHVNQRVRHALLNMPTLTALEPSSLPLFAWPLLPQLPLLRRLAINHPFLTAQDTTRLSTSLSSCRALTDLSLLGISFNDATDEQQQARWTELLGSVPQLHRFEVQTEHALPLLAVLPAHLPQLVFLKLSSAKTPKEIIAHLAHPTVQELELRSILGVWLNAEQMQQIVRSPRMPQLVVAKSK
jgi:hypothetical protein